MIISYLFYAKIWGKRELNPLEIRSEDFHPVTHLFGNLKGEQIGGENAEKLEVKMSLLSRLQPQYVKI